VAVVALPPPLAAGVCGTAVEGAVRGRAVKTHLLFDRPVWREYGLSGWSLNDSGPLMYTVDSSTAEGLGVLTGFVTGRRASEFAALPAPGQETDVRQQLAAVFPELPPPREVVVTDWVTSRYSSGCYATLWGPGRWGGPPRPDEPASRVVRCGTETSTKFYGFMEGAVRSGHRAAEQVLSALVQPLQEDRQ
jgi:monoamine oxidase